MFAIAGATGHVGGEAARRLLAAGHEVRVIVRDAGKGAAWADRGADVAVGALEDADFLTGALEGTEGFFTLLPPNYAASDFYAGQRTTADAIAQAVKRSRVAHVVLLSSVGADLPDGTGPIKGVHYLENALRATDTKLTSIRAAYFQENVANSLAPATEQGIFPNFAPAHDVPMPMVATKDIGALVARALESPPAQSEIVDLGGPAYSVEQVVDQLGKAIGKELQIVDIPPSEHVSAMVQAGMPRTVAEAYAEMFAGFASGKIRPRGDREEIGKTTLDETIREVVARG